MKTTADNTFQNKIVFITGGANGIGKAIVTAFCETGAEVIFCDTDEEAGLRLCKELNNVNCTFSKVDITDKDMLVNLVNNIFDVKENIDIIINNAGISNFDSILNVSIEDFDKILKTNLRPAFITAKLLAKHRDQNKELNTYGRIINIASTRHLMSEPDSEAYAASKGGIVSLTHALAISLSKYNITVNCISPGWIDTGHYGNLRPIDHEQHPSGRVGIPEDIARACLFLCHPDNNFINGENIIIDGGMTKKMIYVE
ncbi:SDR family oxidoreductase [Dysgonomonas sp. Marseille-P4677]|uniref:SDR family oxidoreductase n=1 Tax=Dysgonomonas sp. Marseille-P4677 TaxID=2364790 RepID=UPI001912E59C|nr:SDR family oxidoreductase [Dysgonomonas sp. Marseille-P4677]MBK5721000.1 SDR family oxidoreductase [Dysgonomonas sp. Marseille-P4677]